MLKSRKGFSLLLALFILLFYNVKAEAPRYHARARKAKKVSVHVSKKGMLFVKNYISKSHSNLVSIQRRSAIPFTIIDSVFRQCGVPSQLKYLAVIESELKSSAKSRVGAVGPWQLMPVTARLLGLKVNHHIDERTNYVKSTKAAARYLKDLYAEFNDWLLVLAAYNGGPGPVYSAIRNSGSRNFWVLQNHLPAESRLHVKRFLATTYYFEGSVKITMTEKIDVQPVVARQAVPPVDDNKKSAVPDSENKVSIAENPDEKFRRLMNESEESLRKSRELLASKE